MVAITARSISVNKRANIRKDRTPVRANQFKEVTYLSDGIIYFSFWKDETKTDFVVFLRDQNSPQWVVSECDDFIMGNGVARKLLAS